MSRRTRRWGVALGLAAVLAGCSSPRPSPPTFEEESAEEQAPPAPEPDPGAPEDAPEAEPPSAAEAPEDERDPSPVGPFAREPAQSDDFPVLEDPPVELTDARLIELGGLDRFVLELAGPVPSWRVAVAEGPIVEQPGGAELQLAGAEQLEVRVAPATSLRRDAADPTVGYDGPTHLDGTSGRGGGAALTADHEGVLAWTLGIAEGAAFAVEVRAAPDRLIVDVEVP